MKRLLALLSFTLLCAGGAAQNSPVGAYQLKGSVYTALRLNEDSTFSFTLYNTTGLKRMPWQGDYILSKGYWKSEGAGRVSLTSSDKLYAGTRSTVKADVVKNRTFSRFVFQDVFGNIIPIASVQKRNGTPAFGPNGSAMSLYEADLHEEDSLTFYFKDHPPFSYSYALHHEGSTVVRNNFSYLITLHPVYQKEFFRNDIFMVKRKSLVHAGTGALFNPSPKSSAQ